ncbi:MAG: MotA/TolQ/ExbB proton channel family protein [Kiritimatiellia bacterium]
MIDLMKTGGPVLWLIIAGGVAAFGVFIERAWHLHRARIRSDDFLKGIFNVLKRHNVSEALTICEETPGPIAYLVKTAIIHRSDDKNTLRSTLEDASLSEISRMERRLVVVATVAQLSPLLGLLGTVLKFIEALVVMQGGEPVIPSEAVTGPLGTALVTTAAGLSVAIPAYAGFNLLVVKIDRIVLDMERAASEIAAFISKLENRR